MALVSPRVFPHLLAVRAAELTSDEDIYRDWLLKAQKASPDEEVRNAELVLDAYNVVDKKEYPPAGRLDPGHPEAYDAIMMTGSSEYQRA